MQWAWVPVNNHKIFVFSPINGFTYLVSHEQVSDTIFLFLLGLKKENYIDELADPAENVVRCLTSSKTPGISIKVKFQYKWLYRFIHIARTFVPIRPFLSIISLLARFQSQLNLTAHNIGQLIHDIETSVDFSDCYPRALLTSYFCLRSRLDCDLVIGSLTPTHKMHAWCCTCGAIPYEPMVEHWIYQPLVVMRITN
jgi:hypothetical protein